MFTWICPQCGGEVPPSYSECPRCAERRAQSGSPQALQPVDQPVPHPVPPPMPPSQTVPQAPPPPAQPEPQQAQPASQQVQPEQQAWPQAQPQPAVPPPQAPPSPLMDAPSNWTQPQPPPQQTYYIGNNKRGMPPWLAAIIVIIALGGGLFGIYRYVGSSRTPGVVPEAGAAADTAIEAAVEGHPYKRHIEVTALRLIEEGQRPKLRFTVVNHSASDLAGVKLKVTLTTTASAPQDEPIAVVDADVGEIRAYETKDIETAIKTTKRVYELPDWQFLKATFELTSPK